MYVRHPIFAIIRDAVETWPGEMRSSRYLSLPINSVDHHDIGYKVGDLLVG
jgi:hypothetical protein